MIPTLADLASMNSHALRGAIVEIDDALATLDTDENGELRQLSAADENRLESLLSLRSRCEAHIRVRDQFERHSLAGPDGNGHSAPQVMFRGDPWSDTNRSTFGTPAAQQELRGRALAANDKTNTMPDASREYMAKELQNDPDPESKLARYVIATSDPDYMRAFSKWSADPIGGHREWDGRELAAFQKVQSEARAMSIGTPGSAGFLVPYALEPQINIVGLGSVNPMRDLGTVKPTAQDVTKVVTSLGVTASWDAEAAEVSDGSPTLLQPSLQAFKGQTFIPVSVELFDDSDLINQVAELFADAKAQLEATAFTLGNGTTAPEGVITGVSAVGGSVVISAGSSLALVDILATQHALPPRWRANATWTANLTMINAARQLPLFASGPSIVDDTQTPPRMFGWQLVENSTMDGTIAGGTTNDYVLLAGDFKRGYQIRDRVGTQLELVATLFGASQRPTGQRGFHMFWRTAAKVTAPDAFRLLNYSA
jgi:HK97 family phage major capsid protein